MDLFSLAIAIGIPSAITGFCFWCLEHHMEKREERDKEERKKRQKEQDEREQAREKGELCIINCINASLALGEATAKAVQRIGHVDNRLDAADKRLKKAKAGEKALAEYIISNAHSCPIPVEMVCKPGFQQIGCVQCLIKHLDVLNKPRED